MKHTAKVVVSFFLAALLVSLCAMPALAADTPPDYTITSPYDGVNWDTWKIYKTNLHTHSTFSDGNMSLRDVVEEYYRQGYEVLAISDHGVVGAPWDEKPLLAFPLDIQNWFKDRPVLTSERLAVINAGSDRTGELAGRGMISVPKAIEMNAAVLYKNHVNGFFGGWGWEWWGIENDYRTAIAMTEKTNGLSFINHPGDWLGNTEAAARNPANINFYADMLRDYSTCLGIEIYNRIDTVTRWDRVLWDELLRRLIPEGRQVFGFSNDDAHTLNDIGGTAEYLVMPSNTVENIRTAMETGTFFACSRRDRNTLGDDFAASKELPFPLVRKIVVNESTDTITLTVSDTDKVEWIADGKVIATGPSIALRDYAAKIGSYVRAQLVGPGGISTTQAFVVDDGEDHSVNDAPTGWAKFSYDLTRWVTASKFAFLVQLLIDEIGDLLA